MRHGAAALVAGLWFGVLTVVVNHAGPRLLGAFVGGALGWMLFALLLAVLLGSWRALGVGRAGAAVLTTTALLGAVLAYYVADSVPADGPLRLADRGEWLLWSGVALVMGPPLGLLGHVLGRAARGALPEPRHDVS